MINISERIITLRKMQNLTTNKLANKAGISQSFLRDIELGKKIPTTETLFYICAALNISMEYFFKEDDSQLNPILLTAISKLSEKEQLSLASFINSIK